MMRLPHIIGLLLTSFITASDPYSSPYLANVDDKPNTTHISHVLNRLVDPARYDKRLRPSYGAGPEYVGITMHIISISAVSEVDMDFTVDLYLRQFWADHRLAFGKMDFGFKETEALTVGVEYLDKMWKPGKVLLSQRLTVTATCYMQLKLFPMDWQECRVEIESYGYTTNDIVMHWNPVKDSVPDVQAVRFDPIQLPQFQCAGYRANKIITNTASGDYVRLYVQVVLGREIGFYLMNIIIPSLLIVCISWVSFWLSRESSPARVALGVTTVLTMTTLTTTTNNSMPKVSYIKAIDVFLSFCFIMVFASLVEYAVVSYWNHALIRLRKKGRGPKKEVPMPLMSSYPTTPAGGLINSPNQSYFYRPPGVMGSPTLPPCDCRLPPPPAGANVTLLQQTLPYPAICRRKLKRWRLQCSPSLIDRISRVVFPCIFVVFNFLYWTILPNISHNSIVRDFKEGCGK